MQKIKTMMKDNTLYMDVRGQGETVVMVHGWGMHSGIMKELASSLSQYFKVISIDLPGHGKSPTGCPLTLEAVAQQILLQVDTECHWLGWSLGGSIVMTLAAIAPERFKSMTLLSANPCFVSKPQWQHGVSANVFSSFADDLQQDYKKTLKKFIALQTLSSHAGTTTLKQLRQQLFAAGEPDQHALRQGLDILINTDLRASLERSRIPCMMLLGERDQLVPNSIATYYKGLQNNPQVEIIENAGHAAFLSHPQQAQSLIASFIQKYAHDVIDNG